MKTITKAGILALCLIAAPQVASAQMKWTDKAYASVNGGGQFASHTLNANSTFLIYDENTTVAASQKIKSSGLFELGGAYRVYGKNLLAGLFYSHASSKTSVALNASVPDPVVYGRARAVTSSQPGAKHSENVVHLDAVWMIPLIEKLDAGVFAGPSILSVKQDTLGTLSVSEPGPTVSAPLQRAKKTTGGFNIGADVQYMVYKKWAAGATARYTWGKAKIGDAKLTVGGFQLSAGARYRF